jgi:hypothetical protein
MRKAMFAITVLSLVAGLLITSFMDMYLQGFTPAAGQMADDLTPTPLSTIYLVHLPVVLKPRLSDEFEMVERFAPVLKFDGSVKDLPMCADTYFLNMMFDPGVSPVIEDGTSIRWKTTDKPSKLGYGPFSDLDGYGGDAKYYSTIQTADVDGDGQAELLGRGSRGIESYIYSSSELWVLLSPPNRVKNCGRDSCRYGMSNRAYQTLINGEMPTYYRVIYNG